MNKNNIITDNKTNNYNNFIIVLFKLKIGTSKFYTIGKMINSNNQVITN